MMKIKTRTRQLCNEKWVGEVKLGWLGSWKAVVSDLYGCEYTRYHGDKNFGMCFFMEESRARQAIVKYLAIMGVGISQYPHPKQ